MKMELSTFSHFTRSAMIALVTLLILCIAIDAQGEDNTTALATNQTTAMTTEAMTTTGGTEGVTTAGGTTKATSKATPKALTTEGLTTETPSTKPKPPGTTGKTKPSGTSPKTPTKSPIKGGFKWATFFCIIILIACLLGIGYCAYQFYRKRQTDSYHTL